LAIYIVSYAKKKKIQEDKKGVDTTFLLVIVVLS